MRSLGTVNLYHERSLKQLAILLILKHQVFRIKLLVNFLKFCIKVQTVSIEAKYFVPISTAKMLPTEAFQLTFI